MRVDQLTESVDLFIAAELDRADLDDVIGFRIRPRSFEIERDEYVVSNSCQLPAFLLNCWWKIRRNMIPEKGYPNPAEKA